MWRCRHVVMPPASIVGGYPQVVPPIVTAVTATVTKPTAVENEMTRTGAPTSIDAMQVVFTRTGSRRYRVDVRRERAADLSMEPAPGFHDHIPHDLVHFVVECHWNLRDGIYGQLAAGGDASTFRAPGRTRREARRQARKNQLSGGDIAESERLARELTAAWENRHAGRSDSFADDTLAALAALNAVALRWHRAQIGGSVSVDWPWRER